MYTVRTMVARQASLLLVLFLIAAVPASGQSPDSITVTEEDWRNVQESLSNVSETVARLNDQRVEAGLEDASEERRSDLANILFVFLAVAVIFEAAMSALFDWRIYIRYLQGRGFKTPILVGVALLVCFNYDLDILSRVLGALDQSAPAQGIGKLVTAFLISGGSSAVFRIYSNLGIRNPAERERKAKEERAEMAENEAAEQEPNNTPS